jgi:tetratricopeptide (TPR) repeat protein
MDLLVAMSSAAFFSDTTLFTWIMLHVAGLSMRYGASSASSFGFAGYAMVLAGAFGSHDEAAAFGQLATALDERFKNGQLAAKVQCINGTFVMHWVRPFDHAKALLRASGELALRHGDTLYEAYATNALTMAQYYDSTNLRTLEESAEASREVGVRRGVRDVACVSDAYRRYASALRGRSMSPRALGTADSSEGDFLRSVQDAGTPGGLFHYDFLSAELAYLFGETDRAATLLAGAEARSDVTFSSALAVELRFLRALVDARRARVSGIALGFGLRRSVAASVRKLQRWAQSSPANYQAHFLIARAELARIEGHIEDAEKYFAQAVTSARAHAAPKREAIALELAAECARSRGDGARAAQLLREAAEAYRKWGADAKAEDVCPT